MTPSGSYSASGVVSERGGIWAVLLILLVAAAWAAAQDLSALAVLVAVAGGAIGGRELLAQDVARRRVVPSKDRTNAELLELAVDVKQRGVDSGLAAELAAQAAISRPEMMPACSAFLMTLLRDVAPLAPPASKRHRARRRSTVDEYLPPLLAGETSQREPLQVFTRTRIIGGLARITAAGFRLPLDFSGLDLSYVDFSAGRWEDACFDGANLDASSFVGTTLQDASFRGASMIGANLSGADAAGVDFTDADLSKAFLIGTHLDGAAFTRAKLYGTHLRGAHLTEEALSVAKATGNEFKPDRTGFSPQSPVFVGASLEP